jgi:predicted transcriptional regulator
MSKEQFGFRLDRALAKEIDQHAGALGQSRNFVIEQCISLGFPMLRNPAFYEAMLSGMSKEELSEICSVRIREVVEERKRNKKKT